MACIHLLFYDPLCHGIQRHSRASELLQLLSVCTKNTVMEGRVVLGGVRQSNSFASLSGQGQVFSFS